MENHVITEADEQSRDTKYHHNCGKVWKEPTGDYLPSYCPGCGHRIFKEREVEYTIHESK